MKTLISIWLIVAITLGLTTAYVNAAINERTQMVSPIDIQPIELTQNPQMTVNGKDIQGQ